MKSSILYPFLSVINQILYLPNFFRVFIWSIELVIGVFIIWKCFMGSHNANWRFCLYLLFDHWFLFQEHSHWSYLITYNLIIIWKFSTNKLFFFLLTMRWINPSTFSSDNYNVIKGLLLGSCANARSENNKWFF